MAATSAALRIGFPRSRVKSIGASQQHLEARLDTQPSRFVPHPNSVSYKPNRAQGLVMQKKSRRSWKGLGCRCSAPEAKHAESGGGSGDEVRRKRLGVFVSGGGSNFRSVHEAAIRGSVHGDVAVLVTDKPGCGGADYARNNGIPVILFPKSKSLPEGLSSVDLVTALRTFEVDILLLAGYLKLIPIELVQAYPRSILNIHPSLLPAFGGKGFYGMKVHRAVIASGARYSGPTVHFVDEHYDTGLILAQRVVPVLAKDTPEQLAARVLREEHEVYVEAVAALCEERIVWREDGVPLIRSGESPDEYS